MLGYLRESLLGEPARRSGSHYTPPAAARAVIERLGPLTREDGRPALCCDPACGSGAFLLGLADQLAAGGIEPAAVVEACLWGCDLDGLAVAVTEASLALWALERGVISGPGEHLAVADGLAVELGCGWGAPLEGFDAVVGNPPFQAQLARATSRSALGQELTAELAHLREPYTDTAALFLAQAVRLARPGGRVALIQPLSFVAARDTAKVRSWLLDETEVLDVWVPQEQVFEADVWVFAPVLQRRPKKGDGAGDAPDRFADLVAVEFGIPHVDIASAGVVGDLATATAGFRDQFYGLAPHAVDAPDGAVPGNAAGAWLPLITSGLIDPVRSRWGTTTSRIAGRRFERPALPVAALTELPAGLGAWVDARRRPKLLLATQTRVLELIVDETGALVPSVPVIAVHADPADLWRLAAAISSPPVNAWAATRTIGAARNPGALKLAARQVLALPLPFDRGAWELATSLLRGAAEAASAGQPEGWHDGLVAFGTEAAAAYGLASDHPVVAWWVARLPGWR